MDDPPLVRSLQALRDLEKQREGLLHGHRPARNALGKVFALHQLHHQEVAVALLLKAEDGRYIRVVERRQRLRLTLEAGHPLFVLREALGQHLDRHLALQLGVARAIHLAHAAGAERSDDLVRAEGAAGFELHRAGKGWLDPREEHVQSGDDLAPVLRQGADPRAEATARDAGHLRRRQD